MSGGRPEAREPRRGAPALGRLLLLAGFVACGRVPLLQPETPEEGNGGVAGSHAQSAGVGGGVAGRGPSGGAGTGGPQPGSAGTAGPQSGSGGTGDPQSGAGGRSSPPTGGGGLGAQFGVGGAAGTPPPLMSTPGRIVCGGLRCDAANEYCCANAPPTCDRSFCSFRRECDETADCVGGEVCCFSVFASPPPVLGSYCTPRAQCGIDGGSWIGCGSDADCKAAGAPACVSQECDGIVQTCGPIRRSACH